MCILYHIEHMQWKENQKKIRRFKRTDGLTQYFEGGCYLLNWQTREDNNSNDDVIRQEQSHRDKSNSHNPNNPAFRHRMNQKSNAHNPCDSAYWESRQQSYRDRHRNQSNRNNPNNPQYRKH